MQVGGGNNYKLLHMKKQPFVRSSKFHNTLLVMKKPLVQRVILLAIKYNCKFMVIKRKCTLSKTITQKYDLLLKTKRNLNWGIHFAIQI